MKSYNLLTPITLFDLTLLGVLWFQVGRKDILKHPVAETFLFLKWRRIRKFFVLSFIYHALFISLYSLFILRKFTYSFTKSYKYFVCFLLWSFIYFSEIFLCEEVTCNVPSYLRPVQYLILLLNLCFLLKEIFQAFLDWSAYIRQWENWLQILIIIGVFLCTVSYFDFNTVWVSSGWRKAREALEDRGSNIRYISSRA